MSNNQAGTSYVRTIRIHHWREKSTGICQFDKCKRKGPPKRAGGGVWVYEALFFLWFSSSTCRRWRNELKVTNAFLRATLALSGFPTSRKPSTAVRSFPNWWIHFFRILSVSIITFNVSYAPCVCSDAFASTRVASLKNIANEDQTPCKMTSDGIAGGSICFNRAAIRLLKSSHALLSMRRSHSAQAHHLQHEISSPVDMRFAP